MAKQKPKTFIELLGKKYQREVLEVLLDQPDYVFTVNEVAKETSGSYNTVSRFLRGLEAFDIVKFSQKGGTNLVEYNSSSKYHEVIKSLLRVENQSLRKQAERYAELLYSDYETSEHIRSIVLFGSVARGSANSESDIDILILTEGENKSKIKDKAVKKAQKNNKVDNEIVPIVENFSEFEQNFKDEERFEINIMRDGIVLEGEELRVE